jgi:hypothetical protein
MPRSWSRIDHLNDRFVGNVRGDVWVSNAARATEGLRVSTRTAVLSYTAKGIFCDGQRFLGMVMDTASSPMLENVIYRVLEYDRTLCSPSKSR